MSKPRLIKLKGGAIILYQQRKLCKASAFSAGFFVGHKDYFATIPGLPHFVEHALFLGTEKYSRDQIHKKIARLNGNAYTTADRLMIDFYVSNRNIDEALDLSSEMLLNPLFPEEELKNELKVVFEEREREKSKLARSFVHQHSLNLFGDTAYNPINVIGTEDNLGKVTQKELIDLKDNYFTLDNFFISINTSLSLLKVKKLVNKYFIKKIKNNKCKVEHDRHYLRQLDKPKLMLVNDDALTSYKIEISNIFKTKKEEFLYDPTLNFLSWFHRNNINNFKRRARKQGLVYSGSESVVGNNAYEFSFDGFSVETSKFENIDEIIKLINDDIKFIRTKPVNEKDIKNFINEEYIDHDKAFPVTYTSNNSHMIENYLSLDKIIYRPFKKRIKEMKKLTLEHINEVIDRIYSNDNDVYITIMGQTDGKKFKTLKQYKKMLFD